MLYVHYYYYNSILYVCCASNNNETGCSIPPPTLDRVPLLDLQALLEDLLGLLAADGHVARDLLVAAHAEGADGHPALGEDRLLLGELLEHLRCIDRLAELSVSLSLSLSLSPSRYGWMYIYIYRERERAIQTQMQQHVHARRRSGWSSGTWRRPAAAR